MKVSTPWIYSAKFDSFAILGPSILVTSIVAVWGRSIATISEAPWWLWALLVLGIDVAHVYSSLFRTYFDKEEFQRRKRLYLLAPLACWVGGIALYIGGSPGAFWAVVTYMAIYHFVRQQYGFMMLYRRGEARDWRYRVDQVAIYLATLYPVLFWHTYGREFTWFAGFEIPRLPITWPELVVRYIYITVLILFFVKEAFGWQTEKKINSGKIALLVTTAVSWAMGIIVFNGDLTFTLINVVSHGIPYLALVWIYQFRKGERLVPSLRRFFRAKYIPVYLGLLLVLAWVEEGMWDWFVYKEHPGIFGAFSLEVSPIVLGLLVPLLTVPQLTHYVLDAYIWRVGKPNQNEVRAVIG